MHYYAINSFKTKLKFIRYKKNLLNLIDNIKSPTIMLNTYIRQFTSQFRN
jgi:hypothetical protein